MRDRKRAELVDCNQVTLAYLVRYRVVDARDGSFGAQESRREVR